MLHTVTTNPSMAHETSQERSLSSTIGGIHEQPSTKVVESATISLRGSDAGIVKITGMEESGAQATYPKPMSDSPTFTAVDGGESSQNPVNGDGTSTRGERPQGEGQPRIDTFRQEKLTITTTTAGREQGWAMPQSPPDPECTDGSVYSTSGRFSGDNPHKRKRSSSVDRKSSIHHNHAVPSSTKQRDTTATRDTDGPRGENVRGPSMVHSREGYSAEVQYRQSFPRAEEREPASANEPWSAQQYSAISQMTNPDDRLRDALAQNMEPQSAYEHDQGTPNSDDRSGHPYSTPGYIHRDSSVQSDLKKRKRNFSNRTKTGCMTCRRRKKKCDETQPECNNCQRGGFVCSGYQTPGQWSKNGAKQAPVPLQSKNEYEAASYTSTSPYSASPSASSRREPLPGYRGQTLRVDPQHRKTVDDEPLSTASALSPENNRLSAISFSQQTPTPISASNSVYAERHASKDFGRMAPMREANRQQRRAEADVNTPQSAKSSMNHILHPQLQSDNPHSAQVAAQLALSHPASATCRQRTQKEEMLAGHHYFPFDKELVLERERCNGACWRFNSSTNPLNGVSPEERARLFRDILQPRDQVVSPTQACPIVPLGRVEDNVVVEAPFNCDYGYNITIGHDVAIGKNCTILDTCEVTIGDRCNIGPNVNIYTADLPLDPKRRLGSRGPSLGSKITIEADCWIGGSVTILPGRTIHKGSVVGAGSVVTRDVPPYTVACGNPAHVQGAVYREG